MNPQTFFYLLLFGVGVWMLYMMTCRTDDWLSPSGGRSP